MTYRISIFLIFLKALLVLALPSQAAIFERASDCVFPQYGENIFTNASGTTRDVIDPSSKLLVRNYPNGTKTFYVYGLGLLYEVDAAEKTKTYHFDQVGSTIARTDGTGKVIGTAEYSAYGLTAFSKGDMATPFLYNGQAGVQTDANGLLNMRARYYSPYLMRFLNADPIGFSGGMNWFAYADGNPVSLSDPFGFDAVFFYGDNAKDPSNRDYFKTHAEAQANSFNQWRIQVSSEYFLKIRRRKFF